MQLRIYENEPVFGSIYDGIIGQIIDRTAYVVCNECSIAVVPTANKERNP